MTTYKSIIEAALTELGVLAGEEEAEQHDLDNGLKFFLDLLGTWSVEGFLNFDRINIAHSISESKQLYTLGNKNNDITAAKIPARIDSIIYNNGSIKYPVEVISKSRMDQYDIDPTPSTYDPSFYTYHFDSDTGYIKFNVPLNTGTTITLTYRGHIGNSNAQLDDELDLPEGYANALRLNLAKELASSHGVKPSDLALIIDAAKRTKRNLKIANAQQTQQTKNDLAVSGDIKRSYYGYAGNIAGGRAASSSGAGSSGGGLIERIVAGAGLQGGGTSGVITVFVGHDSIIPDMLDADDAADKTAFRNRLGITSSGSSAHDFTDLGDSPADYTGEGGKYVRVKSTEDGVEFDDIEHDFTDLTDTPANYTGAGGRYLKVNAGANAIEFVDADWLNYRGAYDNSETYTRYDIVSVAPTSSDPDPELWVMMDHSALSVTGEAPPSNDAYDESGAWRPLSANPKWIVNMLEALTGDDRLNISFTRGQLQAARLTGEIPDAQIPSTIVRDTELPSSEQLVPAYPATGNRNDKTLTFHRDSLGWEIGPVVRYDEGIEVKIDGAGSGSVRYPQGSRNDNIDGWGHLNKKLIILEKDVTLVFRPTGFPSDFNAVVLIAGDNVTMESASGIQYEQITVNDDPTIGSTMRLYAETATKLVGKQISGLLPDFPVGGSRDNKIPKFDGDTLGWEVDAGAGAFDIHDDISDQSTTLASNDRFAVSKEDEGGDPQKYITAVNARHYFKSYIGTWSSLSGHQLRVGDIVHHNNNYYIVKVLHNRGGTGPDQDTTNFQLLTATQSNVDTSRLLPSFPASGSRNDKILKFARDSLAWEAPPVIHYEASIVVDISGSGSSSTRYPQGSRNNNTDEWGYLNRSLIILEYNAHLNFKRDGFPSNFDAVAIVVGDEVSLGSESGLQLSELFDGNSPPVGSTLRLYASSASEIVAEQITPRAVKLLPDFPTAGQRNDKVLKFNNDTLGWEADAEGSGGASAFSELTGSIALTQIPDNLITPGKLTDAAEARLLPTFPALNDRNGKVPKFSGNSLAWAADAEGGGDAFDLWDDVTTEVTDLEDDDRFVIGDDSASGNPNRYITADNARRLLNSYRGQWSALTGHDIYVGDLVEHSGRWYICIVSHERRSTGPDGDSTHWVLINNWGGAWTANSFWPIGVIVSHSGGSYISSALITNSDPAPNASTNTKWVLLGKSSTAFSELTGTIALNQVPNNLLTAAKLAENSVGNSELQDDAVYPANLRCDTDAQKQDMIARLGLPRFPSTGSRNDKVMKFNGDTLGWETDAAGTAGSGEENVQADWDETDTNDDSFIRNKPTIPGAFDLHDDVSTETLELANNDRFLISDESETGDPNSFITATNAKNYFSHYRGEWGSLTQNTDRLYVGDVVTHNGGYFFVKIEHNRGGSGPDGDSTNFDPIETYWGDFNSSYDYSPGRIVKHSSKFWINNAAITSADPAPGATGNTKWIRIDGADGESSSGSGAATEWFSSNVNITSANTLTVLGGTNPTIPADGLLVISWGDQGADVTESTSMVIAAKRLLALGARTSGDDVSSSTVANVIKVASFPGDTARRAYFFFARTSANKLLVAADNAADDPAPLTIWHQDTGGEGTPEPVLVDVNNDTTYNLEDKWEEWKNKLVMFKGGSTNHTLTIQPNEAGTWAPGAERKSQTLSFAAARVFPSADTWTVEPANGSRPAITEPDLLPSGSPTRLFGRVRFWREDGRAELILADDQNENIGLIGEDLSDIFETDGEIVITQGSNTITIPMGADTSEPYNLNNLSASKQTELRNWVDRRDGSAVTVELKVTVEGDEENGGFIDFQPLWTSARINIKNMHFARRENSGGITEYTKSSLLRQATETRGVPFRLINANDFHDGSTAIRWHVTPQAGGGSSTSGGSGQGESQGAFDLRREEELAASLSGTTYLLGGSTGYDVDANATHLEIEVTAPANLSPNGIIWHYQLPGESVWRDLYDDDGDQILLHASSTVKYRFNKAFFHETSATNYVKTRFTSTTAMSGSLTVTLRHEEDVNSASINPEALLESVVTVSATTLDANLASAAFTEVELEKPVEWENLQSLFVSVGTTNTGPYETGEAALRITKDEIDYVGDWRSTDSLSSGTNMRCWFSTGWVHSADDNSAGDWRYRVDAAYAYYWANEAVGNTPSRIIAIKKEGAYMTALYVAGFRQQVRIEHVSCMRKI